MKLKRIHIQHKFKRFTDLTIDGLQPTAKLVVMTGPNGCGKTSLFEAFNYCQAYEDNRTGSAFDPNYHPSQPGMNWQDVLRQIKLEFHDISDFPKHNGGRKCFYIRSAYRHEADLNVKGSGAPNAIQLDANRPLKLVLPDERVSENYLHLHDLAASLFLTRDNDLRQQLLGEVADTRTGALELRDAIKYLFDDLMFDGVSRNITSPGTFTFTKGGSKGFHYINLSGGEKAAFDLLLDFIIKRKAFDDTIYCIDEPELHMHSRLQAKLLEVMFNLIPDNCQLWIATHSIGMARKAAELYRENLGQVAFIDFHGQDFDQAVTLKPIQPDRKFWRKMFHTALDDLAELVVPEHVVFCEGKKLWDGGRKPSFDVNVYQTIFGAEHPDVEFIPLGGASEVQNIEKAFNPLLRTLVPGIKYWKLFDRDDRHGEEIQQLQQEGAQVLQMRDLESYLWNNEIIEMLCASQGCADKLQEILEEKRLALEDNPKQGKAADDIKFISGRLYNKCKQVLGLTQCGNDAEAFALYTLAPLVTPDTKTYQELEAIVMAPIIGKAHDSH